MTNRVHLWSFLYRADKVRHTGPIRHALSRPLKMVARVAKKFARDPIVRVEIANRALLMPWSHGLPDLLRFNPHYETELGRLASYLDQKEGSLCMIDVGANVGDTVATIPELDGSQFLCIEGSEAYFGLLQENLEAYTNVTLVCALLGDQDDKSLELTLSEVSGSAYLEKKTGVENGTPWMTLDEVVQGQRKFSDANLLKVDTDGYDLHVLRGATTLLKDAKPCLHVELSSRHWRDYGATDPADGFRFLAEMGYEDVLIYDHVGYLVGRDSTRTASLLNAVAHYSLRKPDTYFNLLAFHATRPDVEEFYASEIKLTT